MFFSPSTRKNELRRGKNTLKAIPTERKNNVKIYSQDKEDDPSARTYPRSGRIPRRIHHQKQRPRRRYDMIPIHTIYISFLLAPNIQLLGSYVNPSLRLISEGGFHLMYVDCPQIRMRFRLKMREKSAHSWVEMSRKSG